MFQNPSDSVQGEFSADHRTGHPSAAHVRVESPCLSPAETIEGRKGAMRESGWKGNGWGAGAQTAGERKRGGGWQRGQWSGLVCVFMRVCVSACVCTCEGTRSRPSLHTLLPHYWRAELIPQQWAPAPTDVTETKRPPDIFTHAP